MIDFQKLTCPLCRQSLIEPGNEHEPQSWQESDPDVGMHMFVTNGSVDLDRFLSGMHSIDQSTQRGDDNGSDSVRHEYSGMYSWGFIPQVLNLINSFTSKVKTDVRYSSEGYIILVHSQTLSRVYNEYFPSANQISIKKRSLN